MIDRIRRLWRRQPLLLLALVAALAAFAFFGVQSAVHTLYWMDPAHRQQALEPWMTPRYVSMSYRIPPDELGPALGLTKDSDGGGRMTMATVAERNGMTLHELQVMIDALAAQMQAERQGRRDD